MYVCVVSLSAFDAGVNEGTSAESPYTREVCFKIEQKEIFATLCQFLSLLSTPHRRKARRPDISREALHKKIDSCLTIYT